MRKTITLVLVLTMILVVSSTALASASWSSFNLNQQSNYNVYDTFAIQNVLSYYSTYNFYNLNVDGVFGPTTTDAVKDFQRTWYNPVLTVDGKVGANTWTGLRNTLTIPFYQDGYAYYGGYFYDEDAVEFIIRDTGSRWQTLNQAGQWRNFGV